MALINHFARRLCGRAKGVAGNGVEKTWRRGMIALL